MASDYQMLRRGISSVGDYAKLEEEFKAKKRAALQQEQMNEMMMHKTQKEIESGASSDDPANIREWNAFKQMTPEQQKQYLTMKRASQIMNLGGTQEVFDPLSGGVSSVFKVTPEPEQMPDFRASVAGAETAARQGLPPGQTPMTPAQVAATEKAATGKTEAATEFLNQKYPSAKTKGEQALKSIAELRGSGGKGLADDVKAIVGFRSPISGAVPFTEDPNMPGMPRVISGSPAASGRAKVQQARGQVFLEAFESLKGGGAITQIEGQKGEQAKARLDVAQDEESFSAALDDLEEVVNSGIQNIEKRKAEYEQFLGGLQDPLAASRAAIEGANAQGIRNQNQTIPTAPLDLGAAADVEFKLRKQGFSQSEIDEYMRVRGLK